MWQQYFGTPYGESRLSDDAFEKLSGNNWSERLKSKGPPTQEELDMHKQALISYVSWPTKKTDRKAPPPRSSFPPPHAQKKAEQGMVFAFVGGLLAGLLLAKRT